MHWLVIEYEHMFKILLSKYQKFWWWHIKKRNTKKIKGIAHLQLCTFILLLVLLSEGYGMTKDPDHLSNSCIVHFILMGTKLSYICTLYLAIPDIQNYTNVNVCYFGPEYQIESPLNFVCLLNFFFVTGKDEK